MIIWVAAVTYIICNILIFTGVETKYLAGRSDIFVLDEWVVKIDLLVNRSTHWPVGWPIHQVQPIGQQVNLLAKNPDLLANTL